MRWNWRKMAQMMENLERIEAGIMEFPRTRTSRVPSKKLVSHLRKWNSEI